jgi:hypothetical protein
MTARRWRFRGVGTSAWLLGAFAVLAAVLAADVTTSGGHAIAKHMAPFLLAPLAVWLFLSERYERTLAVLLIYLGCIDGFVKLSSGSSLATLGRDLLLYSITLGATARAALRRQPLPLPPFLGLVLAWVVVCLTQLANPSDVSLVHSLAALRQHLEFVPLFFFGFAVLRTPRRLSAMFILLLVVAVANGVVDLIQSGMSPTQLASWGPGYQKLEFGSGLGVPRTFLDAAGLARVRPPGLGGEDGFGGLVCLIAVPGVLALLSGSRRALKLVWLLFPALVLIIIGIVTSQSRLDVVASVAALIAFLALTLTSRRSLATLLAVVVVGAIGWVTISSFAHTTENRYRSIAPAHLLRTATSARSGSLSLIPTYLARYPLGAGLGKVGPAASSIGGTSGEELDGETEFNFLIVETGIPGLLVMIVMWHAVVRAGLSLRRVADPSLQRSLMALTAVVVSLLISWMIATMTANSPSSPFFWATAGALSYWYAETRSGRVRLRPRTIMHSLAHR